MIYFWIFLFGVVGILSQSTLKIIKINERTPSTVSIKDIIKEYIRSDFGWIFLSILFLVVWVSIVHAYVTTGTDSNPIPWINQDYVKIVMRFINGFTAVVMYSSQSIITMFTSRTEKILRKETEN